MRYDLPWESPYVGVDGVDRPSPRVRELRMNFGTERWKLRKSTTDLQPPDTVQLDLQQDDAALLGAMRRKTRYNLRLSGRRGVVVERGGLADLPEWYATYRATCDRKGIVAADLGYFRTFLELAGSGRDAGAQAELLVARYDGNFLGGVIVAAVEEVALYLYGATSYRLRHLMPSYALQWEALRWARDRGCSVYDLHGIPPNADPSHPMHGLYRFKTGFGGRRVHRRGCWDYPFDEERYRLFGAAESTADSFHLPYGR